MWYFTHIYFSVSWGFVIYKNRIFLREIIGMYFFRNFSINLFFFIFIFILFSLFTLINVYYGYIVINNVINFNKIFLLIPVYLSVAIIEEFVFRIFIFSSLIHFVYKENNLIIISSFLFAIYHFPNSGLHFSSYFLGGIMYGYSFVKFQSILVPIGLHFSWNYVQGAIFGYAVSGNESEGMLSLHLIPNDLLNGGIHGPEGSIIGVFMRLLVILFIYFIPYKGVNKLFLKFDNPFP